MLEAMRLEALLRHVCNDFCGGGGSGGGGGGSGFQEPLVNSHW